jgi:ribosomal protein S15P/S13E
MKTQQRKIRHYTQERTRLRSKFYQLKQHLKIHQKDNTVIRRIKIISAGIKTCEKRIASHQQIMLLSQSVA